MKSPSSLGRKSQSHLESSSTEELQRVLVEYADFIRACASCFGRRQGFTAEESEDFSSWVIERLIDGDYSVLRSFRGRSFAWKAFLRTVVANLGLDFRRRLSGRFRPSKMASELGALAVRLEELIFRDGYSFEEAAETLLSERPDQADRASLERIRSRLPDRPQRPRRVGEESLATIAAKEAADSSLRRKERQGVIARAEVAVSDALSELSVRDRMILRLRFAEGLPVRAITSALRMKQSTLYFRIKRSLARVRDRLESQGMDGEVVINALANKETELRIDFGEGEGTQLSESHATSEARDVSPSKRVEVVLSRRDRKKRHEQ